ncbi:MAG: thymidylate kinase [Planctomycetota bacterium]|jgi:dTMP kinase|nr:thymidylate kinase [Planctomycetota bacterium]
MAGIFISLEGIDGIGKSLQMRLLAEYFQRSGHRTWAVHFPRTAIKPYGDMIAAYLRGDYGDLDVVAPCLAALLYALDRREAATEIRERLAAGIVVIADRYVHSNIAYQGARTPDGAERKTLIRWIEELEYIHHKLPRPDLSLFLNAPLSFALKTLDGVRSSADRDYLKSGKDIHETDILFQEKVRTVFLDFAHDHPAELMVVDCHDSNADGMAGPNVIHSRIVDALRYFGVATR